MRGLRRKLGAACLLAAVMTPAFAADLKACAAIDDASARLACYDELAGRHAAAAVAPAPVAASTQAPEQFGAEQLHSTQVARVQEPSTMQAHIVGSFEGWEPKRRFKLDNGQVWVVVDDRSAYIAATQNPPVTIEKGMFGAYYLSVEGLNSKAKVKRVQ